MRWVAVALSYSGLFALCLAMPRRMVVWGFQSEPYSGIRQLHSDILCPANNLTRKADFYCWYVYILCTTPTP